MLKQTRELIFHSVLHHIFHVKLVVRDEYTEPDYFSHKICYSKENAPICVKQTQENNDKEWQWNESKERKRGIKWSKKKKRNTKCNWKYFVMWTKQAEGKIKSNLTHSAKCAINMYETVPISRNREQTEEQNDKKTHIHTTNGHKTTAKWTLCMSIFRIFQHNRSALVRLSVCSAIQLLNSWIDCVKMLDST